MTKVIGIDLGTSNSVMAIINGEKPKVIPNSEGDLLTPSVVTVVNGKVRAIGEHARAMAANYPENTIFNIKRLMGRKFREQAVQVDIPFLPYKVIEHINGDAWVEVDGVRYSPQEISAMILQKLKWDAEAYLGENVTQAIITIPAYFTDVQRQATRDAGTIAGLDVLRIINEPTAASLAYGLDRKMDERILVFSFGGGSLDISVLECGEGVFEVKAALGDTHLGGSDLDKCIINYLVTAFYNDEGVDISQDPAALQRLREASEKAKIDLSSVLETEINIAYIAYGPHGPLHLHKSLTRRTIEELTQSELERINGPLNMVLSSAYLKIENIDDVILVGGQTRMPAVQQFLRNITGKELQKKLDPDTVVALGAAIQAGVLTGDVRDVLLLDVVPFSIGINVVKKSVREVMNIEDSTNPGRYKKVDVELEQGILSAYKPNSGLEGLLEILINRNDTIPIIRSRVFTINSDNQTSVEIDILQGEHEKALDNLSLSRFVLTDIPTAFKGKPQIEVTFDIDANGILKVQARDKRSGRSEQMNIQSLSGLTLDDLNRLRSSAETYDQMHQVQRQEQIIRETARDEADNAKRLLRELSPFITPEQHISLEIRITELYAVLAESDSSHTNIEIAREALQKDYHNLAADIYQARYGDTTKTISLHEPKNLHIFVSHSHIDNLYCRLFVKALSDIGANVWYDENQLQQGELTPIIEHQLIERQIFIPIITPAALKSRWVYREVSHFYELYQREQRRIILPVMAGAIGHEMNIWPILRDFKRVEGVHMLPITATNAAQEVLSILSNF